ncbi:LIM domain-containing protein A-like [Littorina saxatilis]
MGSNGRSWGQCSKKWRDLKTAVESKSKHGRGTGGGEPKPPVPFEDIVMGIIGLNTTKTNGIDGGIDTSSLNDNSADTGDSDDDLLNQNDEDDAGHKDQPPASVVNLPLRISPLDGSLIIETNAAVAVQPSTSTSSKNNAAAVAEQPSTSTSSKNNAVTVARTTGLAAASPRAGLSSNGDVQSPFNRSGVQSPYNRKSFARKRRQSGFRMQENEDPEEDTLFKEWLSSDIRKNNAQTDRERAQTDRERLQLEVLSLKKRKIQMELLYMEREVAS